MLDFANDLPLFEAKAGRVAELLRTLGNVRRLMVLCTLTELGSATVNQLAEAVGLSQSALSQHLGRMREEHLVTFDRDGQTLHYRVTDPRLATLLATLCELYCADDMPSRKG